MSTLPRYVFFLIEFSKFSFFFSPRIYRPEANQNGTISNGHGSNGYITRGTGGLHEDVDFPANLKTLTRRKPVTWMRPHVRHLNCIFYHIFSV